VRDALQRACSAAAAGPDDGGSGSNALAFSAAAALLCPNEDLWLKASTSIPLARNRKALLRGEQCGGAGALCCAFALPLDGGKRAMASCADAPFPGRECVGGTECVRVDEWYWECA
jgi:hypothetical protein